MPKLLDKCIQDVKRGKKKGGKAKSPWAVCIDSLKGAGLIKQKNGNWVLTQKGKKRSAAKY